tara:strand:+ start:1976 stop:2302 length:327 start_codon:yes stop_codon:yes gene_type:complete
MWYNVGMKDQEKHCDIEMYSLEGNAERVAQIRASLSETATQQGYLPANQQIRTLAYDALGLIQQMERDMIKLKEDLASLTRYDIDDSGNWPHSDGDWVSFEDIKYTIN